MARHKLDDGNIDASSLFNGGRDRRRPRNPKPGVVKNSKDAYSNVSTDLSWAKDRDVFWSREDTALPKLITKRYLDEHPEDPYYGRGNLISDLSNAKAKRLDDLRQSRIDNVINNLVNGGTSDVDKSDIKSSGVDDVSSGEKYAAVKAKKGELPYQTWERATGLKWSEAKKRGYTTGRDQENLQLQRDLLAGNVSKQGGYSEDLPEGYKNSKLGQGSYYLSKPKQTASAQAKPTASASVSKQVSSNNDYVTRAAQYRDGYISNKNVPSISGEITANRDYVPGQKFNPYKTVSFSDDLGKNTKSTLYSGGHGTGGGQAKLPTQNTSKSTDTSIGKKVEANNSNITKKQTLI